MHVQVDFSQASLLPFSPHHPSTTDRTTAMSEYIPHAEYRITFCKDNITGPEILRSKLYFAPSPLAQEGEWEGASFPTTWYFRTGSWNTGTELPDVRFQIRDFQSRDSSKTTAKIIVHAPDSPDNVWAMAEIDAFPTQAGPPQEMNVNVMDKDGRPVGPEKLWVSIERKKNDPLIKPDGDAGPKRSIRAKKLE